MADVNHLKPGGFLEWISDDPKMSAHRWEIMSICIGGLGQENIIEIENVSHKPGHVTDWGTIQTMFVPDCLLRDDRVRFIARERGDG